MTDAFLINLSQFETGKFFYFARQSDKIHFHKLNLITFWVTFTLFLFDNGDKTKDNGFNKRNKLNLQKIKSQTAKS